MQPVFHATVDDLKARLRLSGAAQEDALTIIDGCIEQVRIYLYDGLGADRIDTILDTVYVEEASTPAEVLRSKASMVEAKWVRLVLMRELPHIFLDAPSLRTGWNEEGMADATRGPSSRERELSRLETEIADGMTDLAGATPDFGTLQISTIGPDETPPRPGESLRTEWP